MITRTRVLVCVLVCAYCLQSHMQAIAWNDEAHSQPSSSTASKATVGMSSEEFTQWVKACRAEGDTKESTPILISRAVLDRLRDYRYIADDTVLSAVNAWVSFESRSSPPGASSFKEALEFIRGVMLLTADRPTLHARLHCRAAELLRSVGQAAKAMEEYEQSVRLLTQCAVDVEHMRLDAIVQIAGITYAGGAKSKAEALYLQVLSYPWYIVEDAKAQQELRNLYVTAGRGVIECRRHNIKALRGTFFFPATMDMLGPLLKRAIKEAEGSPVDLPADLQANPVDVPASRPIR